MLIVIEYGSFVNVVLFMVDEVGVVVFVVWFV